MYHTYRGTSVKPMLNLEPHRWAKVSISYPSCQCPTGFPPSLAQTTQKLHTPGPQQQLTLVSLFCIRQGLCKKLPCSHSWWLLLSRSCWSLLKRRASAFVRAVANPVACCSTPVTGSILCALIAWWCTIYRFCTWIPSLCTRFTSQCMKVSTTPDPSLCFAGLLSPVTELPLHSGHLVFSPFGRSIWRGIHLLCTDNRDIFHPSCTKCLKAQSCPLSFI